MNEPIRDGHQLKIWIDDNIRMSMTCPYDNADLRPTPYADLPKSYASVLENGDPDPDAGQACNVCTWVENGDIESYLDPDFRFEVTTTPVMICWDFDSEYLHLTPSR